MSRSTILSKQPAATHFWGKRRIWNSRGYQKHSFPSHGIRTDSEIHAPHIFIGALCRSAIVPCLFHCGVCNCHNSRRSILQTLCGRNVQSAKSSCKNLVFECSACATVSEQCARGKIGHECRKVISIILTLVGERENIISTQNAVFIVDNKEKKKKKQFVLTLLIETVRITNNAHYISRQSILICQL